MFYLMWVLIGFSPSVLYLLVYNRIVHKDWTAFTNGQIFLVLPIATILGPIGGFLAIMFSIVGGAIYVIENWPSSWFSKRVNFTKKAKFNDN